MKYDTLIKNGKVVIPRVGVKDVDICITGGKVSALVSRGEQVEAKNTIDATGKHVFPGVIDPHVHWGYSGWIHEEVPGESRAAIIGGCTSVVIIPAAYDFHERNAVITNPDEPRLPTDDLGFAQYKASFEKHSFTDFAFTFKIPEEARMARIPSAMKDWGVTSFKIFMVYNGFHRSDIYFHYSDTLLLDTMGMIKKAGKGVAVIHCENGQMVSHYTRLTQEAGEQGLAAWNHCRPDFSESDAMNRLMYFAELTGCPTLAVHISNRKSLEVFSRGKKRGLKVWSETLPNFLLHNIDSEAKLGVLGKTIPPLRTKDDNEALWEAVFDGTIDIISSDCCAARKKHKLGANGDIWTATAAYPGPATNFPLLLSEGYHKRGLDLTRIAELCSFNAANIYGLYPQKGTIMPGSDADLAIVDLNLEKTVTPEMLQGYCDYSVWDGWKVKGWPTMTLRGGDVIMKDGQITAKDSRGKYLRRD